MLETNNKKNNHICNCSILLFILFAISSYIIYFTSTNIHLNNSIKKGECDVLSSNNTSLILHIKNITDKVKVNQYNNETSIDCYYHNGKIWSSNPKKAMDYTTLLIIACMMCFLSITLMLCKCLDKEIN